MSGVDRWRVETVPQPKSPCLPLSSSPRRFTVRGTPGLFRRCRGGWSSWRAGRRGGASCRVLAGWRFRRGRCTRRRTDDRADLDDPALERGLAAAGHFDFDRYFAALHFVRIELALLDRAFDVHRVHAQEREDRVAWLDPFVLLAFHFFDDAIERGGDDAAMDGLVGRVELGLSW